MSAMESLVNAQVSAATALTTASAQLSAAAQQLSAAAEAQAKAAEAQAKAMADAQQAQLEALAAGAAGGRASKAQLAQDLVAITRARQQVDQAQDDLRGGTLRAPIDGVVGKVEVTENQQASTTAGITVLGPGASEVTIGVPLALMSKVEMGQEATVIPPGTTDSVTGTVTSISPLPNQSSTGPTYPMRVEVKKSPIALTTGVTATVKIVSRQANDVLTVPVSALTPTDDTHGTVSIVRDGQLEQVPVTTGVVGGGRVEIMSGLDLDQQVVIGDPNKPLPAIDIFGGGGGESSGGGSASPSGTPQPSSTPS